MEDARSSPSRVAGVVCREVTLGGETLTLSTPDLVRKAADEEALVLGKRLDMFPAIARACAGLPPEERDAWRKSYIAAMIAGFATLEEWDAYYKSRFWPLAFRLWHALDPKHKGRRTLLEGVAYCYELVSRDAVTSEELDALALSLRAVSQAEALGN